MAFKITDSNTENSEKQSILKGQGGLIKNVFTGYGGNAGVPVTDAEQITTIENLNKQIREGLQFTPKFAEDVKKLTKANRELTDSYYDVNGKLKYTIVNGKQMGDTFLVGASGLKGFASSLKLVGKQLLLAGVQFIAITIILAALSKGFEWLKNNIPTKSNLRRWAEESAQALEETNNEIEDLNSQLETTRDRINELEGKRSLSFVEQKELENLKLQNTLLERQLRIKENLAKEQGKEEMTFILFSLAMVNIKLLNLNL